MGTINGTIKGVTLLSGNPEGSTALDSTTVCERRAYLVTADFGAYTGSTDTSTITGIVTAIAAATRNGKTLVLRAVVPCIAGMDANSQGVHMTGTAVAACTIANPTTTGDATGQLSNAAGTEVTSTSGTTVGVGVIAIVDEE
jgi:hypothetical protein